MVLEKETEIVEPKPMDIVYAALVICAFLFGIVVTYSYYSKTISELETSQKQQRKAKLYNLLAASIIETKNNDYKEASKNAGEFFKQLEKEKAKGSAGVMKCGECEGIRMILESREKTLGGLNNQDNDSQRLLMAVHAAYIKSMGKDQ